MHYAITDMNKATQYLSDWQYSQLMRYAVIRDETENIAAYARFGERMEIAKNALQMNLPIDTIAKLTGLTPKEIEGL